MTTDQILTGVGLTVALAVGSQILAHILRIPAIVLLLPAGFVAGALTEDIIPTNIVGTAFEPLVSLAVAVILFDSGVGLDLRRLSGSTRRVVSGLIVLGVPITWAIAALSAGLFLGMSSGAAVMIGVILVVSGPTVVGPLLSFVRPSRRVQTILGWESSVIDPIGGILGALTFHAVVASDTTVRLRARPVFRQHRRRARRRGCRHRVAVAAPQTPQPPGGPEHLGDACHRGRRGRSV
jgi:NhaP-type Na+/H+ or K+/H+ antiporter